MSKASWSAAEFLDAPCAGGFVIRALVCPLEDGVWQWSVISFDTDDRGELISSGSENSATAARRMAASEIAKCVENPIGELQAG